MTLRTPSSWPPLLMIAVAAAACDSPTEPALGVPPVTLEAVGDAVQLEADGAGDDLPRWESLDPDIVTVTPAGMAVAVAEGTATVRARLGSRTAEGQVTVMPPVEVVISDLHVVTEGDLEGMSMRLANMGGRGFYRLEFWGERSDGEVEHRIIQRSGIPDYPAEVGLDVVYQNLALPEIADWVIVYSREPLSLGYELTGCVRLDGGSPCPLP